MTGLRRPGRYPVEFRERAVRMVFEAERHCGSQWAAITSVAEKLGSTSETVRKWVRRLEVDDGRWAGVSTDERQWLRVLELENRELRRANEILKTASAFFAAELDDPRRWSRSSTHTGTGSGSSRSVRHCSSPLPPTGRPGAGRRRHGQFAMRISRLRLPGCMLATLVCTERTRCGRSSIVKVSAWLVAQWSA